MRPIRLVLVWLVARLAAWFPFIDAPRIQRGISAGDLGRLHAQARFWRELREGEREALDRASLNVRTGESPS